MGSSTSKDKSLAITNKEEEKEKILECPVCSEEVKLAVITVDCNHTLCRKCLDKSLAIKDECPLCRKPMNSITPYSKNLIIRQLLNDKSNDEDVPHRVPESKPKDNKPMISQPIPPQITPSQIISIEQLSIYGNDNYQLSPCNRCSKTSGVILYPCNHSFCVQCYRNKYLRIDNLITCYICSKTFTIR